MQAVVEVTQGEMAAIDGKTIRGSFDRVGGLGPIHMVSAWAKSNGVSLGQVKTDERSNEITAIPALLGLLELRGGIVTLDAMGCQGEIAEKIREQGADYVVAVKANQKELHEAIEDYFETVQQADYRAVALERVEKVDSGHGRVEVRRYELVGDLGGACGCGSMRKAVRSIPSPATMSLRSTLMRIWRWWGSKVRKARPSSGPCPRRRSN
jgi:predicted transposase YbfD/YdcC